MSATAADNFQAPIDGDFVMSGPAPRPDSSRVPLRGDLAPIGLAGRYPGAADLDALWDNLAAGRDSIGEIPAGLYPGDYLKPVGAALAKEHGHSLVNMPEERWLPIVRSAWS